MATNKDSTGTILAGVAPIYLYDPIAPGQLGLAVSGLTSLTPPAGATVAVISVEGAGIRYRDDGTAPTATVGMPVAAGGAIQYAGPLTAIQFYPQSGSPTINVLYYKNN